MPGRDGETGSESVSSRLIVKNLPLYYTQDKLRSHFALKFADAITDVKLVTTPDGHSRRFGYIGFRSDHHAAAARAYYDQTFIDTARLQVDYAKPVCLGPAGPVAASSLRYSIFSSLFFVFLTNFPRLASPQNPRKHSLLTNDVYNPATGLLLPKSL